MNRTPANERTVVVVPAVGRGRVTEPRLRRMLERGDWREWQRPREMLHALLEVLGFDWPADGLGALRMWGQTGDRPAVWIAAADPVYLEPRLDHLCLHAFSDNTGVGSLPGSDLRPLIDYLQRQFGDAADVGFARIGSSVYLRVEQPIETAALSALALDGRLPDEYLPEGPEAGSYRRLRSEVEMALHDHPVNQQREGQGQRPVNSLWFWGGGLAPEQTEVALPPLFGISPLARGYWLSRSAETAPWQGSLGSCLDAADGGFVAIVPEWDAPALLADCLTDIDSALQSGRLNAVTLLSRDGFEIRLRPAQKWRFWRRGIPVLQAETQ